MDTEQLADAFASKFKGAVRPEDNTSRLRDLESKLPTRLPPSFESLLSRYSFAPFDASGISFFGWGPTSPELFEVALAQKGSLSELLLPAGYFQIGRPDTGSFDAVCFDMNTQKQNREYRIVLADHEEILSNLRVKISSELWPSFRDFLEPAPSPCNAVTAEVDFGVGSSTYVSDFPTNRDLEKCTIWGLCYTPRTKAGRRHSNVRFRRI
jgi:hypothetical protein